MMDYKTIYQNAFGVSSYNDDPGADKYTFVLDTLHNYLPDTKGRGLDVGSGKGYMLSALHNKFPDLDLFALDVDNFLNRGLDYVQLFECDITKDWPNIGQFDFVTCLDVLEHIEKDKLEYIVEQIHNISDIAYITVGNHNDIINGVELHITREKLPYWTDLLEKYFTIKRVHNRDDVWYYFELHTKKL